MYVCVCFRKKCDLPKTNKRFLSNMVMGAMASNRKKMRLEPEQQRRRAGTSPSERPCSTSEGSGRGKTLVKKAKPHSRQAPRLERHRNKKVGGEDEKTTRLE